MGFDVDLGSLLSPWRIGGALVAIYAYTRFNTPPTSRSSTTWGRYHTWAVAYTAAFGFTWYVVASTPELLHALGASVTIEPVTKTLAAPLYAALVLAVAVSGLKPLRAHDERFRDFLQDLARIPWEALRLSAILRRRTWAPTDDRRQAVAEYLANQDFHEHDIVFDHGSVYAAWAQVTGLYLYVQEWPQRPRFSGFYHGRRREFDDVDKRYDELAGTAKRLFRLLATLKPRSGEPKLGDAVEELELAFKTSVQELQKTMCDLISRGLLTCTFTEAGRLGELRSLGFRPPAPDRLFDQLLALFLALGAFHAVVVSALRPPDVTVQAALVKGVLIATIYVTAVFSAIVLKRWEFGRPNDGGRPIRAYTTSALLAAGLSLVTSLGLQMIVTHDLMEAAKALYQYKWPWTFMAVSTAFITAFTADDAPRPRLRWLESAAHAVAGAVMSGLVLILLRQLCPLGAACHVPPAAPVVLTSAVTCALIGALVPSWYRDQWARRLRDEDLLS